MTITKRGPRPLGTMVVDGVRNRGLAVDLEIARRLGASVVELLPDWRVFPDPRSLARQVLDAGLAVHSAHGCWGGQAIRAPRVDLGDPDPVGRAASVDDLKRCVDWLDDAGGTCLVVHPGGLSDPASAGARREALRDGFRALADHARGTSVVVCVENMPPGVHPGSRTADLAALLDELARPELALALDTGHAQISSDLMTETADAGPRLRTTHVHDNDGRKDAHLPPGLGIVPWDAWPAALDAIGYEGPVMLECVRHLRERPETLDDALLERLRRLTRSG